MPAEGLWGILAPVVVGALVLLSAGVLNRRFAPLQRDTLDALKARIDVLESERNECKAALAEVAKKVESLTLEVHTLTAENLNLLRRRP